MKKQINKLFTLFAVLLLGFGQMWATDIFSASCKVSSDVTVNASTTDQAVTSAQADITGGSLSVSNGETSNKKLLVASAGPSGDKKAAFAMTNGKTYFKVTLSQALEAGDVISAIFFPNSGGSGNGLWFSTATTRPSSAPTTKADAASASAWTAVSYTVATNDGICGETTFCIFRGSSTTTSFTNLVISRSSGGSDTQAPTLSSSTPADGATDVAVDGTIVLTFSEAIASVDGTKFSLSGATIGTVAIDGSDATKVNVPYSDAANSATVTLSVDAEAVADAAGNKSAALSDIAFTTVAAVTPACPSGISISGTTAYTEGETISLTTALEAGNGEITYTWYKGSIEAGNEVGTGASFSKASCATSDAGNYYCVASKDACPDASSSAYAVTVAAVSYCAELYPATSGASPTQKNEELLLQTEAPNASYGGKIYTAGAKSDDYAASFTYTANGLQLNKGGADSARVELNHLMKVGTVITATLVNPDASKARGYKLLNMSKTAKATWQAQTTDPQTYTYTVVDGDGLAGTNKFLLNRAESSALKELKVSNCGAELLDLSSAVDPVGKATITLSKNLVEAGGTATATYSAIDAAYDFDEWVISGATIDDHHANPVTITMGSTAATITLKLKAASVKYAVHFDSKGGSAVADQLVEAGGHASVPTVPTKFKYTFGGWSETDGGSTPADLGSIAINAEKTFYAIWTDKVCPTSGTIFSVSQNGSQPASEVKWTNAENDGARDVSDYFNVVNGIAALVNNSSSNNQVSITTDPKMKFSSDANGWAHLRLECALAEGDVITLDNTNKCIVSYTADKAEGTTYTLPNSTSHTITVPASWAGQDELYIFRNGSNFYITSISIVRPAKYAVTFNMHDHGDAVAEQSVVEGGKVTKPTDPTASGWDFGGWFTDDTYGTYWDFENMTISSATEIHALWTVHTTSSDATLKDLTVGGVTVAGFDPATEEYYVVLEMGTTTAPTVSGTANDDNVQSVVIMQTDDPTDDATITVTAEDNTTKVYTVHFSVATSKAIQLVFKTGTTPCVGSASTATQILSNNAAVSTYINQITFTNVEGAGDDGAEGSSLNVGKKAGNMFTLSAKAGYAFQAMNFLAKIQDATCEYSIDGGAWTELASTSTSADECYAPFTSGTVHEFRLRSTGTSGVWIRNMQLTIVEACTPVAITWDEEPVEFEVGAAGQVIAATANTGNDVEYSSNAPLVIAVDAVNGLLSISDLGSATLSASTAEGDGTTYCENSGNDIVINKVVNTYYLVQFDAQNGEAADEVKYYAGDAAIALPAAPSYPGYDFQGWFDAETGGNQFTEDITPTASMTVYAQWVAQCDGATITTQPVGASYLTGRTPAALVCEATAGAGGALTYEWFTCDDDQKTNPVAASATPSTAVAGTFYYFCKVMEAGCDKETFSNVVTITVTDKDPICLAWVDVTGQNAASLDASKSLYAPSVSAAGIKNSSTYDTKTGWKFNSSPGYVAIEGAPFKSGDIVEMFVTTTTADKARVFNANEAIAANVVAEGAANMVQGANKVVLTADANNLYLRRGDDFGGWNPYVAYIAVYRACAPILKKVTIAGVEGTPNALNKIAIEVPASTADAALEAIAYDWVSNDASWTAAHAPAVANAWEWGVENTLTFADKDGDESVYYVTISKAAASSDATLSELTVNGIAIALVPDQYTYAYEFEYGTAETPAPVVAAVANDANRKLLEITQASTTSGTATVEIVAEDESTTLTYTINFSVCRVPSLTIYDGKKSNPMTSIDVSGSITPGLEWTITGASNTSAGSASDLTFEGKTYSRYVNLFTSATNSTTRYMTITIPDGYLAKFRLVGCGNGSGSRSIFLSKEITNVVDESIAYATTTGNNVLDGKTSNFQFPGTYYLCCNNSIRLYELSVQLYPIDYSRDVTEGRFGTICLPNGGVMVGAAIFEIAYMDYQNNKPYKIFFDEVLNGEMVAGRPYIFLPNAGATQLGVYYTDAANAAAGNFNGLYGSYSRINLTADAGNYILKDNRYYYVNTDNVYCGANRAYIKLAEVPDYDPGQPAYGRRRVSMGFEGAEVATGIEMTNDQSPITNKVLINGELFILRGDKMYDATGRLVK